MVRVDESGRVTLRNRKFLRKYTPVYPTPPLIDDFRAQLAIPVREAVRPQQPLPLPTAPHADAPHGSPQTVCDSGRPPVVPSSLQQQGPEADVPRAAQNQLPPASDTPHVGACPPVPRMLRRLQPHNLPGLTESPVPVTPGLPESDTPVLRRSSRHHTQLD